jgi:hypothetical protein
MRDPAANGHHTAAAQRAAASRPPQATAPWSSPTGFTVIGPDHFISSGHPDFRDPKLLKAGRPPLLGLVETRDAGRTWMPASLLGEVDFHVLEVAHGTVYGFDATSTPLSTSRASEPRPTRARAGARSTRRGVPPPDSGPAQGLTVVQLGS